MRVFELLGATACAIIALVGCRDRPQAQTATLPNTRVHQSEETQAGRAAPDVEVDVIAMRWVWNFEYGEDLRYRELRVPSNSSVRLSVRAVDDGSHHLSIPDYGIDQVITSEPIVIDFKTGKAGRSRIVNASRADPQNELMRTWLLVVDGDEFDRWLQNRRADWHEKLGSFWSEWIDMSVDAFPEAPDGALFLERHTSLRMSQEELVSAVELGQKVHEQLGCVACHSHDGSKQVGPTHRDSWKNALAGKTRFSDGSSLTDLMERGDYDDTEAYVRASVEAPRRHVVDGYSAVMPTFKGRMQPWQLDAIVAYLRALAK